MVQGEQVIRRNGTKKSRRNGIRVILIPFPRRSRHCVKPGLLPAQARNRIVLSVERRGQAFTL